ncbi:MAG: hypothetical protein KC776_33105 [Myxococcales bacterium]|nr:hypothetical protein [Myxococcales bacterium]MCB9581431.1 hypothetical protein [Polyangiaceae bacterium]
MRARLPADARCGVSGVYAGDPDCVSAEPSAPDDESWPKWGSYPGCCRADGTCGVSDPAPGAGCVASAELGLETVYCDGGPADAGATLDAAPDANPDPN